jgi:hypothetical protein
MLQNDLVHVRDWLMSYILYYNQFVVSDLVSLNFVTFKLISLVSYYVHILSAYSLLGYYFTFLLSLYVIIIIIRSTFLSIKSRYQLIE